MDGRVRIEAADLGAREAEVARFPKAPAPRASPDRYEPAVSGIAAYGSSLERRWCWLIPITLSLGVLSLVLLVWVHRVHDMQRTHFALANALMDLRIWTATSHLWAEEAISGQGSKELSRALSDLDEVERLSKLLAYGGDSEYGLTIRPPTEPKLRQSSEQIARLASEWQSITRKRIDNPRLAGEGSAIEAHSDAIFDQLQSVTKDLEYRVETRMTSENVRMNQLVAVVICCWALVITGSISWLFGWQRTQRRSETALQSARDNLELEVARRTRELSRLNEQLRLELAERKRAEDTVRASERQLHYLSSQLLKAQEQERSRIAKELHDDLGHSLILIKMQLGLIRSGLDDEYPTLRYQCNDLLSFVDATIEDARRLAKDLRPSVLDALGLSGAISWLFRNIERSDRAVEVAGLPIKDIDSLLSPDVQVVVFRTLQEALTNVEKHSRARRVLLHVTRESEQVRFVVEDDGIGFDVNELAMTRPSEKGLGMATMDERARMIKGSLTVSSIRGKGSRVTLSVPVPHRECA